MKTLYLETSSYLPLIWRTPYSMSLLALMHQHVSDHAFLLQRDCIREAAGYFSFDDNWRYDPAVRIRSVLSRLSDSDLAQLGYPSAALQLLLGGNIWPQAKYLNFVRHTAFFFVDLVDGISWERPRDGLSELAHRVEQRLRTYRQLVDEHLRASEIALPMRGMLPYWGRWYLLEQPEAFRIGIVEDPRPYNMTGGKLRDIYHYDCAINDQPLPSLILVANTGFERHVRTSFTSLPCPIVCARACSAEIFAS